MGQYLSIAGYGRVPVEAVQKSMQEQGIGMPGAAGNGQFQLGMNAPTLNMGLSALNTVGNLWGAWQANKLARDQFNFTKDITNTNLANQIQSYNTTLEDRGRARAAMEGQSAEQAQAYIDQNRLSR